MSEAQDPMTPGSEAPVPTPHTAPRPPAGNLLKNGNRGGNPWAAPRCLARTRRGGAACQAPAMRNAKTGKRTRCFHHGGASTGPRTAAGLARLAAARTVHGGRSGAVVGLLRQLRETRARAEALVARLAAAQRDAKARATAAPDTDNQHEDIT